MLSSRKYLKLVSFPTVDGIVSAGLLRRIFSVKRVILKIHPRQESRSILVGVPPVNDMVAKNCFIIDVIKCERFWSSNQLSNIFLCDDNYGSLTDLVVATFDLEIPEEILDALFESATLDFESGSIADDFILANLTFNTKERLELLNLVTKGMWNKFRKMIDTKINSKLTREIKKRREYLRDKFIQLRNINLIKALSKEQIDDLAARAAAILLSTEKSLVFALTQNEKFWLLHGYSGIYNLLYLSENLDKIGITSVARPHYIRIRIDKGEDIKELIHNLDYLARRVPKG